MIGAQTLKLKGRAAAAAYGRAVGIATCLLLVLLPVPVGFLILSGALCLDLACYAAVVWHRTRLPLMALGALIAAVGCGVQVYVLVHAIATGALPVFFVLHAMAVGSKLGFADLVYLWPMVAAGMICVLLMYADFWWHRAKRDALSAASENCTLADMLLFRHVPDLRRAAFSEPGGDAAP